MESRIYSISYRRKHTWKNFFPCIAFKKKNFSLGIIFCLFSVLCTLSGTKLSFAVEEKNLESMGQSSHIQGTPDGAIEQTPTVLSDTKQTLKQKENSQLADSIDSLENSENSVNSEQNFLETQQPQEKREAQEMQGSDVAVSSVSIASEVSVNPKESEEVFQKDMASEKQNTLQRDDTHNPIQSSFTWASYFQAIGIMLFLLLVLWYVLKLVRKFGNGRFLPSQKLLPRDSLYLEGQLPLGPGKSVVVANILGQRLVLGVTEKNITLITKMVDNEDLEYEQIFQEKLQNTE